MIQVEAGVWAFYSGDMNQDEFIDTTDFPIYDADNQAAATGHLVSDLNGDGITNATDYPIFDNNNQNAISSMHP